MNHILPTILGSSEGDWIVGRDGSPSRPRESLVSRGLIPSEVVSERRSYLGLNRLRRIGISALLSWMLSACTLSAAPEYPEKGSNVYDPAADGFAQIKLAVTQAKAEKKRIILDFGANWCPWCHKLDQAFHDPAVQAALDKHFIFVAIDVNRRKGQNRNAAVNEKYGNPIKDGIPVLVVLDSDGTKLTTQSTDDFESGDHHDPAKILVFLNRWAINP